MSEQNDNGYRKIVKIAGFSEKEVREKLDDYLTSNNPKVDLCGNDGEVKVTIEAMDSGEDSAKKLGKAVVKEVKDLFGSAIYSTDDEVTLEHSIVDLLKTNNLTVATVESCTGGMVASRIIDVPGASDVYKEGFVTYSNKAKKNRVGVKKSTLLKHGAVSEQTAKEMAKGCINVTKADVAIATTGIAGPDGGTEGKPVGLVYIGCNVCGKTKVSEYHFDGDRMSVRCQATCAALALLRMCVLEYYSEKNFS